jgi:hypothetical protein
VSRGNVAFGDVHPASAFGTFSVVILHLLRSR